MTTTTGIDFLRAMVGARVKQCAEVRIAAEISISADHLRAFAEGSRALPVEKLRALAKQLTGGHAEYDSESGMMRSSNRTPARPLSTAYPGPYKPPKDYVAPLSFANGGGRLRLAEPPKPQPKTSRPGWLGGFFGA
jgi:hypothetical protein